MAVFNSDNFGQNQGGMNWGTFAGGAAAGAGGYGALSYVQDTRKAAKIGEGMAVVGVGLQVLGGNSAQSYANAAMANANAMANTASVALSTADGVQIRSAIQNLAQGLQSVNPLGYLGLQTSTQPAALGSTTPAAATQNLTGILLIGLALFLLLK